LEVDASDNIYQTGQLLGNSVRFGGSTVSAFESTNAFLAKYDGAGNLAWYRIIGSPRTSAGIVSNFNCGNALQMDNNGDLLLIGFFMDTLDLGFATLTSDGAYDLLLLKYNTSGALLQAAQYTDYGWVGGNDICVDQNNRVYITGMSSVAEWNSTYPFYAFIAKLGPNVMGLAESDEGQNPFLYPNPFSSELNLVFPEHQTNTLIRITDILGKELMKVNFSGRHFMLEAGTMKPGAYFVHTISEGRSQTLKVILR
jgi:hypothetical protein